MNSSIKRIAPAFLYHLPPAPAPPPARASTPPLLLQLDAPPVQLQTFNHCAPTTYCTANFWSKCTHLHLQLRMMTPNHYIHLRPCNNICCKSQSSPLCCPTHPWHTPCSTYQQTRPICKKRRKHFPHDQVHLPLPGIFPIHRGVGDLPCLLHVVLQILQRERNSQDLRKRLRIIYIHFKTVLIS